MAQAYSNTEQILKEIERELKIIVCNTEGGGGDGCCPATNSLLTEIRDNTADIEITAETINLNTDDLEACCAAGNVLLTSIEDNQTNGSQETSVNNGAGAAAVNIQDGGNSITVDGTFFQATQPVSAATLPLPTGAATSALQTQPGVDIGDVTVNNAAGAAAVNIQDGGNSITVDGTVAVSNFPATITNYALETGGNLDAILSDTTSIISELTTIETLLTPSTGAVIGKFEDLASANADGGVGCLAVRKATPANTSGSDGDYEFIQMSAGRVWTSSVITDMVPGTAATSLGKAEDAAHASGDVGIEMLGVRNDTRATTFGANGDYTPIAVDSTGATFVNGTNGTGAQTITSNVRTGTTGSPTTAGNLSVGFATSSDFTGTINGVARLASTFYGFEASVGRTLPTIAYNATAGSITIDELI